MENLPNQEIIIKKEDVLKMLREKDPNSREVALRWIAQQEAGIAKENTSRAGIVFNLERTDLYLAVDDTKGAIENLEDALEQARNENEADLEIKILEMLKTIERY